MNISKNKLINWVIFSNNLVLFAENLFLKQIQTIHLNSNCKYMIIIRQRVII